jgi:hypothetical protein
LPILVATDSMTLGDVITALASIVSAVGAAYAARAASCSASTAKFATESLGRAEKRLALRELDVSRHNVMTALEKVESVALKLKSAYRGKFTADGQSSGSRLETYVNSIDERVAAAKKESVVADELSTNITKLYDASLDDLSQRHTKILKALIKIQSINDDFEHEIASIQ